MAGRYDFTIEQGATFSRQVTWQDESGAGINLTGYTITGKLRKKTSDNKEIASFTCALVTPTSGIFSFSLTPTQTSLLPSSFSYNAEKQLLECVYDIEASSGSNVYRVLEGIASISPEVTR